MTQHHNPGPGIEVDGKLAEGGVTGHATDKIVKFTGVTSCLTFTVFYKDGTVSAGHIGTFAKEAFQNPDDVVRRLQEEAKGKEISSLVVVGETGLWADAFGQIHTNQTYGNTGTIMKALVPSGTHIHMADTAKYGSNAHIEVHPTSGVVIIKDQKGNELDRVSK